jgi:hypothetical protein
MAAQTSGAKSAIAIAIKRQRRDGLRVFDKRTMKNFSLMKVKEEPQLLTLIVYVEGFL